MCEIISELTHFNSSNSTPILQTHVQPINKPQSHAFRHFSNESVRSFSHWFLIKSYILKIKYQLLVKSTFSVRYGRIFPWCGTCLDILMVKHEWVPLLLFLFDSYKIHKSFPSFNFPCSPTATMGRVSTTKNIIIKKTNCLLLFKM